MCKRIGLFTFREETANCGVSQRKRSGTSFITGECVIVQTKGTLYVEVKQSVFHNRLRFRKPLKNKGKINLKKF